MKKLLLITGDLATGKSRFAEILSKRYCISVMYKDKIKEVLGDTVGFADREENLRLSLATMELMIYGFKELSELQMDVILEANFKEGEMARLTEIAEEKGYSVLTLLLKADMDVIYKRFVNRIENENRHPVHISGFDGYESLKYYIEKGREQKTFGRVIEISANDFAYQADEKLLEKIDNFMGLQYENH